MESLGTPRPPPWGCGRAAPSAPSCSASSLMICTTTWRLPTAGIQNLQMRLRELVYADVDICLLASLPEQLQSLIDALAAYCATVRMEISVQKPKVMVVSAVPAPAVDFTCNGNPVEQPSNTWDFISINQAPLRAFSHQSKQGLVVLGRLFSGLIHCCSVAIPSPCTCICCKLCLVPVLQCGCQMWGMHSHRVAVANNACAALQRLYDHYLTTICHLLLAGFY